MESEKIGIVKQKPPAVFDWSMEDFMDWFDVRLGVDHSSKPDNSNFFFLKSPTFSIGNVNFCLAFQTKNRGYLVAVWLCQSGELKVDLRFMSLSLVALDGSEEELCSKVNVKYKEDAFRLDETVPDANFGPFKSDQKFFPNGNLTIRCRVEIKSEELLPNHPSLADNLGKLDSLQFSDAVLVILCFKIRFTRLTSNLWKTCRSRQKKIRCRLKSRSILSQLSAKLFIFNID